MCIELVDGVEVGRDIRDQKCRVVFEVLLVSVVLLMESSVVGLGVMMGGRGVGVEVDGGMEDDAVGIVVIVVVVSKAGLLLVRSFIPIESKVNNKKQKEREREGVRSRNILGGV